MAAYMLNLKRVRGAQTRLKVSDLVGMRKEEWMGRERSRWGERGVDGEREDTDGEREEQMGEREE